MINLLNMGNPIGFLMEGAKLANNAREEFFKSDEDKIKAAEKATADARTAANKDIEEANKKAELTMLDGLKIAREINKPKEEKAAAAAKEREKEVAGASFGNLDTLLNGGGVSGLLAKTKTNSPVKDGEVASNLLENIVGGKAVAAEKPDEKEIAQKMESMRSAYGLERGDTSLDDKANIRQVAINTIKARGQSTAQKPEEGAESPVGPQLPAAAQAVNKITKESGGELYYNGSTGEGVKELQLALGVKADGFLGDETEAAIEQFQKKQGLKNIDGVVGSETLAALGKISMNGISGGDGANTTIASNSPAGSDKNKSVGWAV